MLDVAANMPDDYSSVTSAIVRYARMKIMHEAARPEPDLRRLVIQCEMVDRMRSERLTDVSQQYFHHVETRACC